MKDARFALSRCSSSRCSPPHTGRLCMRQTLSQPAEEARRVGGQESHLCADASALYRGAVMRLGAHESTSGGLHEAFPRALADGAEALQIFTKSSRMWRSKEITRNDVALFRAAVKAAGFSASVHASYLINLGCVPGDLREKSIEAFIDELQRCDRIGAPYLIVHPGSCADTARGLVAVAEALDRTFAAHKGNCIVLLETAAGQGSALGRTFEELREIRDQVRSPDRVAICLDTCHVFAAGYDISTDRGYDETFGQFERVLGIGLPERLVVSAIGGDVVPGGEHVARIQAD